MTAQYVVPEEWMDAADAVLMPGKPLTTSDLRRALAAVLPLAIAQERERCAALVDCDCAHRAEVLAVRDENSADRWRACGSNPCSALEARAIRQEPGHE